MINWTFNLRRCNVSFIFGLANNELSSDLSYGAMQKSDTSKTYQFENEITFSPRVFVKNVSLASDPRDSACLKVLGRLRRISSNNSRPSNNLFPSNNRPLFVRQKK